MTYANPMAAIADETASAAALFWGEALGPGHVDLFTGADNATMATMIECYAEAEELLARRQAESRADREVRERRASFRVIDGGAA
jgi:hypothetical protein